MDLINYYEYTPYTTDPTVKHCYESFKQFPDKYDYNHKINISKKEGLLILDNDKKIHYWIVDKKEYAQLIEKNINYALQIMISREYTRYLIGSINVELVLNEEGFKAVDIENNQIITTNRVNCVDLITRYLLK